ncbi:MAG TPA: hypothetical protein VFU43_03995 [Streptosporangiaceae bacterium]|nr:hypothetical protein [Streptosporangiaceae bacterium]
MLWLDDYERRARLAPGLLALLPVVIVMAVLGLRKEPVVSAVITAVALGGGPLALAELVRRHGRKAQESLWSSWGGALTTQKLRLREPTQNSLQRETWRKAVSSITGIELASVRRERANPTKADEAIEVVVGQIRDLTRDGDKFPLVRAENRGYGFHRNLYGIRWIARFIALVVVLGVLGYMFWLAKVANQPALTVVNIVALAAAVLCLAIWFMLPSAKHTRDAADRYAYELLQAAVVLASEKATIVSDSD